MSMDVANQWLHSLPQAEGTTLQHRTVLCAQSPARDSLPTVNHASATMTQASLNREWRVPISSANFGFGEEPPDVLLAQEGPQSPLFLVLVSTQLQRCSKRHQERISNTEQSWWHQGQVGECSIELVANGFCGNCGVSRLLCKFKDSFHMLRWAAGSTFALQIQRISPHASLGGWTCLAKFNMTSHASVVMTWRTPVINRSSSSLKSVRLLKPVVSVRQLHRLSECDALKRAVCSHNFLGIACL